MPFVFAKSFNWPMLLAIKLVRMLTLISSCELFMRTLLYLEMWDGDDLRSLPRSKEACRDFESRTKIAW